MSCRVSKLPICSFLILLFVIGATPLFAQVVFNSGFPTQGNLVLNGTPDIWTPQVGDASGNVLRLTKDGFSHISGSAWYGTQQNVANGFTSTFQFQITSAGGAADGFAFVIQNSTAGTAALGGSGGAIGYGVPDTGAGDTGTPISNSIAFEFDTFQNGWDPDNNHIAIQSCGWNVDTGGNANSQDHTTTCKLGIASPGVTLADGLVHNAKVEYDPPQNPNSTGILRVFVDNDQTPKLTVNVTLSDYVLLNDGLAYVGFTAGTGALTENSDILNWTFTPATAPTTITQTLNSTGTPTTTNYVYGTYNYKVGYQTTNSDTVAVTATPTSQSSFTPRLGQQFPGASCLVYDGTGGLCVVFSVQCSATAGTDCTSLDYNVFNNFNYSNQGNATITRPCVLKAPIGTSGQWSNIIESFTQTRNDPGTTSKSKGFSDFVLAQNCTALPSIALTPANGASFLPGQSVPITYSCTADPSAPFVSITSCTATLSGNPLSATCTTQPNQVSCSTSVTFNQAQASVALQVTASDSLLDTAQSTSTFAIAGPGVNISPTSINFGDVPRFGLVSQNVTVTNVGSVPLLIGPISITNGPGTDDDNFYFQRGCGPSLGVNSACTITVFFWGDDLKSASATLNINDNALASPQHVSLSANVVNPRAHSAKPFMYRLH